MKQVFENADKKMNKTINALTSEFAGIRAGRANPAVLDKIMVDYYGSPTAINQLAAISVTEARTLTSLWCTRWKRLSSPLIWELTHRQTAR